GAVGVHARQDDLAGPQPLDLARPGDRLAPGRHAAAVDVDLPDLAAVAEHPLRVDVDDDALAAEPPRRAADEFGVAHRRRVDRDLVRPGVEQGPDVVEGPDAAADGHRHEADLGRAPDHVPDDLAPLVARRDVEEDQLVGPFLL